MHYSNTIRSRAGLVALIFALIISLASAVPIPVTESILSSTLSSRSNPPSLNGQLEDHHHHDSDIQLDNARIAKISLSGRMSTLPAATRALTRRQQISTTNMDDQLVRRSFFSSIKHAVQKAGSAIKHGVQKVGSAIKHGVKKVGSAIKHGVQKVGSAIKHGVKKVGSAIKHGVEKVKHTIRKVGSAIKHGVEKVKHGIKKVGSAIKHGVKKVGSAIKHGIRKVGHAIKTVAKKAVHGIKTVTKKVGHAIKKAAKNVKHFMATTGAQDLKFGLKAVQTVGEAAGKAATFVPGVGLPAKLAIQGVTKLAGAGSDHIHVKLPPNMQKGMGVMNKANEIMNLIPRRREFSEEEDFQQRDISEAYYFEERDDDVALENREEFYFEAEERDIYHGDSYDY